jgi:type IV secretory pathway ATPase VirB11/archaellum biosynthesis ATPase
MTRARKWPCFLILMLCASHIEPAVETESTGEAAAALAVVAALEANSDALVAAAYRAAAASKTAAAAKVRKTRFASIAAKAAVEDALEVVNAEEALNAEEASKNTEAVIQYLTDNLREVRRPAEAADVKSIRPQGKSFRNGFQDK